MRRAENRNNRNARSEFLCLCRRLPEQAQAGSRPCRSLIRSVRARRQLHPRHTSCDWHIRRLPRPLGRARLGAALEAVAVAICAALGFPFIALGLHCCARSHFPARRRRTKQPGPKHDSPGRSTPSQSPPRSRRNGWLRGAPLARLYDDDAVRQPSRQARDGRRSELRGEDFVTRAGASTPYHSPENGWPDAVRFAGAFCCVEDPQARACPTNC